LYSSGRAIERAGVPEQLEALINTCLTSVEKSIGNYQTVSVSGQFLTDFRLFIKMMNGFFRADR
jgi:hypothetical protein